MIVCPWCLRQRMISNYGSVIQRGRKSLRSLSGRVKTSHLIGELCCRTTLREDQHFGSYPVPKEVGKVGAEDPSFILPVSQRKDGIAAMFKKQAVFSSKTKQGTPRPEKLKPESSQSSTVTVQSPSLNITKEESPPPSVIEVPDNDEDTKNTGAMPTPPENVDASFQSSPIPKPNAVRSPEKKRKAPQGPGVESSPTKKIKKVCHVA